MYMFELQDLLFAIKSIKCPTSQFNIQDYIDFSSASTRSGASNKLVNTHHLNNISRHFYFHRLPALWNAMPTFNLDLPFHLLKSKLKVFHWDKFITILYLPLLQLPFVTPSYNKLEQSIMYVVCK